MAVLDCRQLKASVSGWLMWLNRNSAATTRIAISRYSCGVGTVYFHCIDCCGVGTAYYLLDRPELNQRTPSFCQADAVSVPIAWGLCRE